MKTTPPLTMHEEPAESRRGGLWRRIPPLPPKGSAPRRGALALVDQCFASGSNFLVVVVVARVAGPAGLGAYAVAYSLFLLVDAVHRAIITDPMSIESDARRTDASERLHAGMAAEIELGLIVGALTAVVGVVLVFFGMSEVGYALVMVAAFMPFLLVQDYWRWVGFMQARPGRSLANDAVFNVVQLALLAVLIGAGYRSTYTAIIAWGVGAIAGSAYGLRQFHVRIRARGGYAMVASRWHVSRWLLATSMSGWAGTQAYPFVAGPIIGDVALGGLKAAQSLVSGPSLVLLQAGGSFGLPDAAHALEHGGPHQLRRVARGITAAMVGCVGLVGIVVLAFAPQLLKVVYGEQFVAYAGTARILAVAWVANALTMGPVLVFKVTRNTRLLFRISVTNMTVLIVGMLTLSGPFGANGTAWAILITWCMSCVLCWRGQATTFRRYTDVPTEGEAPQQTREARPA